MASPRARPLSTPSDYGALMLKTPAEAGYRMPAEWERHACCWMSWPSRADQWVDGLAAAQDAYAAVARAIENLLRRYALTVFGHERVAKLTGESWLQFVIAHGGDSLAGAPGRSLLRTAFGNHVDDDRGHWLAAAESFIRRARGNR